MDQSIQNRSTRVVHYRLAGGQVLLLHLETGAYHELNPIGAAIWELVDGTRTAAEIADELSTRVEDPPGDLGEVVESFLIELRKRDLVA